MQLQHRIVKRATKAKKSPEGSSSGDFFAFADLLFPVFCLFASHLRNDLLITDIGFDGRLSNEEDDNAYE